MNNNGDLVKMLKSKLEDPELADDYTIDDFFEEAGVPERERSDFAFAAALKQVKDLQRGVLIGRYRSCQNIEST